MAMCNQNIHSSQSDSRKFHMCISNTGLRVVFYGRIDLKGLEAFSEERGQFKYPADTDVHYTVS